MKHLLYLSILFPSLALTVLPVHAEIDRSQPPEPAPAPEVAFPDYEERTLSNGLKVFFVQSDRSPTVTFRMVIKAGAAQDGGKSGLSSLLSTLLSRGTETRTAAEFAEEIDYLGASFGAGASEDAIYATATGLSIHTEVILDLFADAILRPVFDPGELALEKKKVLSRLEAQRQEPDSLAARLRDRLIFGEHPYAQSATPESVETVQTKDLKTYHRRYFGPDNATLAVVGDFTIEELLPELERAFGNWEPVEVTRGAFPEPLRPEGLTIHLVDRPGSVQSNIVVTKIGPPRNDANVPELQLLNTALGGGMTSRLFANLREKHGYTYGAYSIFSFKKDAGIFSASAEVRNEVTVPAIREMLKELALISTEALPPEELELQRQFMVGNYLLSLEDPAITAMRVQDIEFYGLPEDYYDKLAERLMKTSPEQELKLAKKYLGEKEYTVVVVGDASVIKESLKEMGDVIVYDMDLKRKGEVEIR